MEAIYLPQLLKAPQKTEDFQIQEFIAGLKTLTPIRGRMVVTHGGSYLEVATTAETIVTLTCDRCLQQYNHRLDIDTSELIWLAQAEQDIPLEREVKWEDLSETLAPNDYFQPNEWLYEQLSLAMPMRQLCSKDCQKPSISVTDPITDSRWQSLAALKNQLFS